MLKVGNGRFRDYMPTVERFEDLDVWKRARKLTNLVYDMTDGEVRAQLYLALDRNYLGENEFETASVEAQVCSRQTVSLARYLESKPNARRVRDEGAFYDV